MYFYMKKNICRLTFSPHPHFEAFLESTMLTLISMMLVHRTVFVTSALVRQVSSHRTLEKALATYKKKEKLWIREIFLKWLFMYASWNFFATSDQLRADILKHRSYMCHRKFQEITQYLVDFISLQKALKSKRKIISPEQGLKPWTFRLKAWRSTNWATRASWIRRW